jgi:hypothetical protein
MEAMVVLLSSPKQQIIDRMFEAHRNMQTRFPMSGILERKAYYQLLWCGFALYPKTPCYN